MIGQAIALVGGIVNRPASLVTALALLLLALLLAAVALALCRVFFRTLVADTDQRLLAGVLLVAEVPHLLAVVRGYP